MREAYYPEQEDITIIFYNKEEAEAELAELAEIEAELGLEL